jgi:guanylate kinase
MNPPNELKRIADFRAALEHYRLSPQALQTLSQTKLVLLVAPSSSGRNTIIWELLKTGDYYFVVSDTTRRPRVNDGMLEQNGREYWFRSEDDMLADIRQGKFLEAAIIHNQQVSGISVRELRQATEAGKIAITDAEIAGADNAVRLKPDTIAIFVLPPSFEEWQKRIKHRGAMDPVEYRRRMVSAAQELERALARDYYRFVINDMLEHAVEQVTQITKLDVTDKTLQAEARNLAERLLVETRILINNL